MVIYIDRMHLTNSEIQILLVEKITGTIAAADDLLLERLLAENAAVREQWLNLQQELGQMGGPPKAISEEEAWMKVRSHLRTPEPAARIPLLKRVVVAATILVAVAGAIVLWERKPPHGLTQASGANAGPVISLVMDNGRRLTLRGPQIIQLGSLRVQADQKQMSLPAGPIATSEWSTLLVPPTLDYKISLSDGTEVWLNAQTHLRFPFSFQGPRREVFLEGEAYFTVSKDREHPFIVHTDRTDVLVVGTQFNINTYEKDHVATALVEGAVVARDAQGKSVAIRPGVEAVYTATRGFFTQPFDETEVLSWMKGVYYFHNTPLKDISKVLTRWYNAEIYFKNSDLKNKTFSGELIKTQSLQSFLDNLNLSEEMRAYQSRGKVIFQ